MSLFGRIGRRDDPAADPNAAAGLTSPEKFTEKTLRQLDALRDVVLAASGTVSPEVFSILRQVDDILRPLVGFIETHPVIVDYEVLIQSILTDYIPTPLHTFMSLTRQEQQDGGQADLLLQQQYATIRDNAYELAQQLKANGLKELSVQASFIQTKFEQGV